MRANPSKILLCAAVACVAPAAWAHAHHAPVRPTAAKAKHVSTKHTAAAKPHARSGKARFIPAKSHHAAPAKPHPAAAKAHTVRRRGDAAAASPPTSSPVVAAQEQAAPAEDVHVRHDRKHHFAPAPAAEPRKATPEDFLTTNSALSGYPAGGNTADGAPSSNGPGSDGSRRSGPGSGPVQRPVTGVSHPASDDERGPRSASAAREGGPASQPVSVISVIRKSASKPQVPTVEQEAVQPVLLPALYNGRGRLIIPAAMKGSHEILVHQNQMADHDGLDRIQDDEDLQQMRSSRLLVAIPQGPGLRADARLPADRRYARPWTAQFLTTLAKAHYQRFHSALQVNSAVRTVEVQHRLLRTNSNAAPAEGETASPHLTGQAVDLAKKGLSLAEVAWLRGYLLPLVQEGKIDVEEEFQQSCFHVSVYKKYMPQPAVKAATVPGHSGGSALASAMR